MRSHTRARALPTAAARRYAPVGMPRVAWSGYGELVSYGDISALHWDVDQRGSGNNKLPNTTFPDLEIARELLQFYYAAVSYTDANIGGVLAALEAEASTAVRVMMAPLVPPCSLHTTEDDTPL